MQVGLQYSVHSYLNVTHNSAIKYFICIHVKFNFLENIPAIAKIIFAVGIVNLPLFS